MGNRVGSELDEERKRTLLEFLEHKDTSLLSPSDILADELIKYKIHRREGRSYRVVIPNGIKSDGRKNYHFYNLPIGFKHNKKYTDDEFTTHFRVNRHSLLGIAYDISMYNVAKHLIECGCDPQNGLPFQNGKSHITNLLDLIIDDHSPQTYAGERIDAVKDNCSVSDLAISLMRNNCLPSYHGRAIQMLSNKKFEKMSLAFLKIHDPSPFSTFPGYYISWLSCGNIEQIKLYRNLDLHYMCRCNSSESVMIAYIGRMGIETFNFTEQVDEKKFNEHITNTHVFSRTDEKIEKMSLYNIFVLKKWNNMLDLIHNYRKNITEAIIEKVNVDVLAELVTQYLFILSPQ